jgi:hypothetical protein
MQEIEINVRYDDEHEAPESLRSGHAVLTYAHHPMQGYCWALAHLDSSGVTLTYIAGNEDDADDVLRHAERVLLRAAYAA